MMKLIPLCLLLVLCSCQMPDVVDDFIETPAMEYHRGECDALHWLSTYEAKYGIPPLTTDYSIFMFLKEFRVPLLWDDGSVVDYDDRSHKPIQYIHETKPDWERRTPYHVGVDNARWLWRTTFN